MTRKLLVALAVVAIVAIAGYGAWAWHHSVNYVSTDDAYVEGTVARVSARVSGHVVEVRVSDNEAVKQDDIIVRIDRRDYQAKLDQARAALAVAEASLRAARSEMPLTSESTRAQIDEASAAVDAALVAERSARSAVEEAVARADAKRAAVAAMQAEVTGAQSMVRMTERERERMRRLVQDGYVAAREVDQADNAFEGASAALEASRRRLNQTEQEVIQLEAELGTRRLAVEQARQRVIELRASLARAESQRHVLSVKEAEVGQAEARIKEAQADLAFAELQLLYTDIRAPLDGIVSKKSVEVGQVAQMGQPLMALVPLHAVWVLANFKETQLARLRPGLRAEVTVDSIPGRVYHGTVDSISAGTGSRFSLLPPENATGNWVKVVQRIPVKVVLDEREVGNPHTLRAGMSAVVTIRVR
ncbi:MAG TPA: HlyD family secretion protein [Candidatus Binatia bacterium]|nr:HlyD family secretion protein [Candidatus Binatia bacterium]